MRKFEVISKYKDKNIPLPTRATAHSAGYDLASYRRYVIRPQETALIETGIKAMMPDNEVLLIYIRSSVAYKRNLILPNGVGVVDADYYNSKKTEGHIIIPVMNVGTRDAIIEEGERIAQGIFTKYETTSDDNAIGMRTGGFGSTN